MFQTPSRPSRSSGFTLIETVIYIGLFSLILAGLMLFVFQLLGRSQPRGQERQLERETALVFDEVRQELVGAQQIDINSSQLETTADSLAYTDADGVLSVLRSVEEIVSSGGAFTTIHRLQILKNGTPTWLTSQEVDVTIWTMQPVRNSDNLLNGVRIQATVSPTVVGEAATSLPTFVASTSITLYPYTLEP